MPAPGSSLARALRAASVSLWATLLAAVAHVAGSGQAPPVVAMLPVVVASTGLTWLATARRLGFAAALLLLAVPQVGVHALSGYLHGHQAVPSGAMLAAHAAGLVLMAAGIAVAERLWWSWWSRLSATVRRERHIVLSVRTLPARRATVAIVGGLLDHVVVRRGPPHSWVVTVPVSRARG